MTNTGQTAYTGATFTDDLGGILDDAANTGQVPYYGITISVNGADLRDDATPNGDQTVSSGTFVVGTTGAYWTGDIAPGATITITASFTVLDPDTGNKMIRSTWVSAAAGSNCLSVSTDPRCAATVDVSALTITNTADVATTTPGSVVRYTFTVTDTGQTAYTGATVTAHFAGVLDDATYNADVAAASGSVTINPVAHTATWTGGLAPGATVTITGSVTVNNPDPGNKILTEPVDSTTPGSNCPVGGTNPPACTSTVTVLIPALTITKTADVSTTTPESTVTYTITVTDTGQTPYTGTTVTDDLTGVLNDATYRADAAATTGTVSYTSPDLTWTGGLAVGASAAITYTVTVNNPDTGDKLLDNNVTSTTAGNNCPEGSTDPACTVTVRDLIPALTITKTADTSVAAPDATVDYTITVDNTGQTPYTGATVTDDLTGVLDEATYRGGAAATAGSVSFASPDLTWTGDLAVGASAAITYSVTVNNAITNDLDLENTVSSAAPGSNCPTGSTDPACSVTVFLIRGVLSITAPSSADLGATAPGGATNADLGTITVTDNRAIVGATWTATVSSTDFTTGGATAAETIPAGDAIYVINTLGTTTGSATFTPTPVTGLSTTSQTVVTATNADGENSAAWDPAIQVSVPSGVVGGAYSATITHSVS